MIASAPGKLLLLGEYAVLDGAPAAVVAVDRRARATLRPIDGAHAWVHAPDLEASAQLDLARCAWLDARAGRRLELVRRCVDVVAAEVGHALAPFELTLDSAAFVGESGKLGLGSSAAVCVVSAASAYRARSAVQSLPPMRGS